MDIQPFKHTRLYSLTPRGLGTAQVKSPTSYTVRLAKAHSFRTLTLMKKEIGAVIGKLWLTKEGRHEERKYLNGTGVTASDWVTALQKLTGRMRLEQLSLLRFRNVIDDKELLYPSRRWCPKCYAECLNSGEDVYDQTVWYVKGIRSCITHETLLAGNCPNCKRKQPYLPVYPELSICAHCQKSLAGSFTKKQSIEQYDSENIIAELLLLARQVGQLDRSRFVEKIQALVSLAADGNCSLLARFVGISRGCIENWYRGLTIPKLKSFLQLCKGLQTGPLEFFSEGFPSKDRCLKLRKKIGESGVRKINPHDSVCNWNDVHELLIRIANGNERPLSVHQIEKKLGFWQGKLYHRFPDLCRKITERHYSRAHGRVWPHSVPQKILDEFNRAMNVEPPISMDAFAKSINYNKDYLYSAYPELAHRIRSRFREYKKRIQRQHEVELLSHALSADPPINIAEFSRQTGVQEFYLRRHHSQLCRKLSGRYIRYRTDQTTEKIRKILQKKLKAAPPPSMKGVFLEICRIFGWKGGQTTTIYRYAGDLARAITDRRKQYEQQVHKQKLEHYRKEVKRVVGLLHRNKEYPSLQKIARLVRPKASYTTPWFYKIATEIGKSSGLRRYRVIGR